MPERGRLVKQGGQYKDHSRLLVKVNFESYSSSLCSLVQSRQLTIENSLSLVTGYLG